MKETIIVVLCVIIAVLIVLGVKSIERIEHDRWAAECLKIEQQNKMGLSKGRVDD
jgi:hypothetical protein